ncbi:50S ribosomal protein L28 [Clostridium grantii]|jgi:large subunit ribosomal protein L28|uniref:Large ribosomal subunit protein bL28 n=1 Tax=Clostridium grantii DSM 8605 TaxID=1121316 RepID=A0A1M5QUG7_9CLOT|nr:50S ribosomal protein L28 [Clostridium grantii]SHH17526.1 large subunit ribosomal protein L28 [Clostridium grantii DSM 8605]
MSKSCDICGKGVISGVQYSHSHRQSKRKWAPNVRKVKAVVNGTPKTLKVCTRCLRSGKIQRAV